MTEEKPTAVPTMEELKAQLVVAVTEGDDDKVLALSRLVVKQKADIEKAAGEKLKAEAEAMAGDRAKLADKLTKAIKQIPNIMEDLKAMKALGFTYKLPAEVDGVMTEFGVALTVPTIKAKSGGGGGGSTGKLRSETGMSRSELLDKYATDEEKVKIQTARDDEANSGKATPRPDSAAYNAEKPVIKRILAEHPELIKR